MRARHALDGVLFSLAGDGCSALSIALDDRAPVAARLCLLAAMLCLVCAAWALFAAVRARA